MIAVAPHNAGTASDILQESFRRGGGHRPTLDLPEPEVEFLPLWVTLRRHLAPISLHVRLHLLQNDFSRLVGRLASPAGLRGLAPDSFCASMSRGPLPCPRESSHRRGRHLEWPRRGNHPAIKLLSPTWEHFGHAASARGCAWRLRGCAWHILLSATWEHFGHAASARGCAWRLRGCAWHLRGSAWHPRGCAWHLRAVWDNGERILTCLSQNGYGCSMIFTIASITASA